MQVETPFITRTNPDMARGMTVTQLINRLSEMDGDLTVVMEGDRLIYPHIIVDVLAPVEDDVDETDEQAVICATTVLLSVGPKYEAAQNAGI